MELFYPEDRLPMLGEYVLAWVQHEEGKEGYWCVLLFNNEFYWYHGTIKGWMRLPEPPEPRR